MATAEQSIVLGVLPCVESGCSMRMETRKNHAPDCSAFFELKVFRVFLSWKEQAAQGRSNLVIGPDIPQGLIRMSRVKHVSTDMHDLKQNCPQHCWEFHDTSSGRPSLEPVLKR